MNFEDWQKIWNEHTPTQPACLPADSVLLAVVQRENRRFERTIFWRDVREISVGLIVAAVFAWQSGSTGYAGWIAVALTLVVTAWMLCERRAAERGRENFDDTLQGELDWAVHHTRAQVRILDRIPWAYALPLALAGWLGWLQRFIFEQVPVSVIVTRMTIVTAIVITVAMGIIWLNRWAVRKYLRPRLEQLESLRAQFQLDA
jgi:hypothetical protein